MASGNTLFVALPQMNEPPSSSYATRDTRNSMAVLDFDDTSAESAVFGGVLARNYAGGGITVRICWLATSAVAGDVVWGVSIERHQDETVDHDTDSFAAEKTVTATAPGTSGMVQYSEVAFTSGAEMDSLAAGESFRIKIRRVASDVADTMVGDCEALRVEARET